MLNAGVVYICKLIMKKTLFVLILLAFSLPSFASEWAVRGDYANIRREPSIKGMKIFALRKTQYAEITDIGEKGGWIKVRFDSYVSRKVYNYLLTKDAEVKRLGGEGALVQVTISGWTRKNNLREIVE